jgi:hypothetical protein
MLAPTDASFSATAFLLCRHASNNGLIPLMVGGSIVAPLLMGNGSYNVKNNTKDETLTSKTVNAQP